MKPVILTTLEHNKLRRNNVPHVVLGQTTTKAKIVFLSKRGLDQSNSVQHKFADSVSILTEPFKNANEYIDYLSDVAIQFDGDKHVQTSVRRMIKCVNNFKNEYKYMMRYIANSKGGKKDT